VGKQIVGVSTGTPVRAPRQGRTTVTSMEARTDLANVRI